MLIWALVAAMMSFRLACRTTHSVILNEVKDLCYKDSSLSLRMTGIDIQDDDKSSRMTEGVRMMGCGSSWPRSRLTSRAMATTSNAVDFEKRFQRLTGHFAPPLARASRR